jgi:hypothetical protein
VHPHLHEANGFLDRYVAKLRKQEAEAAKTN